MQCHFASGNVSIWKPSANAIHAHYVLYKILVEVPFHTIHPTFKASRSNSYLVFFKAGLPPGVMQFMPGNGPMMGDVMFNHKDFTGFKIISSTLARTQPCSNPNLAINKPKSQ